MLPFLFVCPKAKEIKDESRDLTVDVVHQAHLYGPLYSATFFSQSRLPSNHLEVRRRDS